MGVPAGTSRVKWVILCRARVGMPPRSPGIGVLLVHQVPESPQAPRIELAGCSTRRHRGRGRRPIRSGCCPRIVVTACGYLGDDGRSTGGRSTIRRPRFGRPWSGRSVFWLTRFGRLRFGRSRFGRGCRWIRAHGVRSGCGWVAVGGGRSVVVGRWWSVGGGRLWVSRVGPSWALVHRESGVGGVRASATGSGSRVDAIAVGPVGEWSRYTYSEGERRGTAGAVSHLPEVLHDCS